MAKKRFHPKGTPLQDLIDQGVDIDKSFGGIFNTDANGPPVCQYKVADNERLIAGPGGANIVLGCDRPDSQASGYGGSGVTGIASPGSSKVDMVCGRMASARKGKGPEKGTHVDNSFAADAARIYICETTDVDKNFGLVEGVVGNAVAKSAIAVKADHTRIIGREGIKIVTGKMNNIKGYGLKGETNSKGGKLSVAPGIDLIAGNNTAPYTVRGPNLGRETIQRLQPVTVAYNMRDCMLELDGVLDHIIASVQQLGFAVTAISSQAAAAFGAIAVVPGIGVPCGVAATVIAGKAVSTPARVISPMHQARATKMAWRSNYLQQFGYKFIGSRSIRATY
jgi:hypothetical protein